MAITDFLNYLEFQRRYSPHTILAYKRDLESFHDFLQSEYDTSEWDQVNHQMVRYWIVSLSESGKGNRTINRKLSSLKSFFKFLIRDGKLTSSPMGKIVSPRQSKKLLRIVSEDEMGKLLDGVDFGADAEGRRDHMIISLFYHTGMRLSELINLRFPDIDLREGKIKVLGKRNKERIIPISESFIQKLKDYFDAESSERQLHQASPVFVTKKGEKLYPKLVYKVVNSYISSVSTVEKRSPHMLRHTFATHMLNRGADLNSIKELLGHSNLSATQIYTHNSVEQLKQLYNKTHPRGDLNSK